MLVRRLPILELAKFPTFVATLLLAGWQCWPLRVAQFGPVDDHRFAVFRGGRFNVLVDGFINAFKSLANIGRTPVFRPVIGVESGLAGAIFGITPSGVFTFVFIKYFIALILIGILARQLITFLAAPMVIKGWAQEAIVCSIVVAAASINAWQGIVPRTGPSESLLALGLLLAASSVLRISVSENLTNVNVLLLFVGVIISAGSKESGIASVIFLIIVARPLIVMSSRSKVLRSGVSLGVLTCAIFPIHAILFTILGQPDLYGTARGPSTIIQSLSERVTSPMLLVLILAVLVIRSSIPGTAKNRREFLTFIGALLLIWIMDGAIYELDSPNLRYRMVYQIIEVLLLSTALVSGFIAHFQSPRHQVLGVVLFFFALNVLAVPINATQTLRDVNQATADATSSYWTLVEAVAKESRKQQRPVVLFSFDAAASYEPIVALSAYLRYLDVDSPIGVFNAEPSDEVWNSPEWLAVQEMQENGGSNLVSPLRSVSNETWICVGFSYTLDNPDGPLFELVGERCESILRI